MNADYVKELRARIGNMKIVLPGVRALVVDEGHRVLLQQRSDLGSWGLPGGVVDVGESARGAIIREVREETGLTVQRADLFGVYSEPRFGFVYPNGDQVQPFSIAFLVTEWTGTESAESNEVLDVRFFPLDELPGDVFPIHLETIADYRNHGGSVVVK